MCQIKFLKHTSQALTHSITNVILRTTSNSIVSMICSRINISCFTIHNHRRNSNCFSNTSITTRSSHSELDPTHFILKTTTNDTSSSIKHQIIRQSRRDRPSIKITNIGWSNSFILHQNKSYHIISTIVEIIWSRSHTSVFYLITQHSSRQAGSVHSTQIGRIITSLHSLGTCI